MTVLYPPAFPLLWCWAVEPDPRSPWIQSKLSRQRAQETLYGDAVLTELLHVESESEEGLGELGSFV